MAPEPDGVDAGDLALARQLVQVAIEYMEQELGVDTRRPAAGLRHRQRLWVLRRQLERIQRLVAPTAPTGSDTESA